jgi:hypothetical protein
MPENLPRVNLSRDQFKLSRNKNRLLAVAAIIAGSLTVQYLDNMWIGMALAVGLYCSVHFLLTGLPWPEK